MVCEALRGRDHLIMCDRRKREWIELDLFGSWTRAPVADEFIETSSSRSSSPTVLAQIL
jgi:hypothetical protein